MCDPISIGIALTVAGGISNSLGNRAAARAQERANNAERARQIAMTAEQQGYLDNTLERTRETAAPEGQEAATRAREEVLTGATMPAAEQGSYLPGASTAPAVIGQAAESARGESRADSMAFARALAKLGGAGDSLFSLGIASGRNADKIGQTGSFKRGSAGVLDSELQAAAQKGATLRGLGQLAMSVGSSVAGAGAFGGAGAGGTVIPGATAPAGSLGYTFTAPSTFMPAFKPPFLGPFG